MNISSATGRMPAIDAPMAAPMIDDSAMGVLRTRSVPCLVERP